MNGIMVAIPKPIQMAKTRNGANKYVIESSVPYKIAKNEIEATQILHSFLPNIILLDIDLRQIGSGFYAAKVIKKAIDIPIILITASLEMTNINGNR